MEMSELDEEEQAEIDADPDADDEDLEDVRGGTSRRASGGFVGRYHLRPVVTAPK